MLKMFMFDGTKTILKKLSQKSNWLHAVGQHLSATGRMASARPATGMD